MYKIGLTGGIGSGKSTVLDWLKTKGIAYIDADIVAREVVGKGTKGLAAIVDAFGQEVLLEDGTLNRPLLGSIIFSDEEKRLQLNALLKEFIHSRIHELTETYEKAGAPLVVYDIPLLIEGNWQTMIDEVWLVYVDEDTQIKRLVDRNAFTREEALARIHSQMSLRDKRAYATVIIDNTQDKKHLYENLEPLWHSKLEQLVIGG